MYMDESEVILGECYKESRESVNMHSVKTHTKKDRVWNLRNRDKNTKKIHR